MNKDSNMKIEKMVELLFKSIPYSQHIEDLEFSTGDKVIEIIFNWRGARYSLRFVNGSFSCSELQNEMLVGTDASILIAHAMNRSHTISEINS
ncbi:hypothetical protein NVP1111B_07 [Vibrio phage 1.111.B._10N.286.45.E6]|nr:hypothetical protein NVP1111A_07 [Vibrio phage 1.111.A._10N.286.45.E6]AUR88263.1 hypothetical protein NVP1111B_07 [Vibrio phage 1.111.B._10N.286.45.E6]